MCNEVLCTSQAEKFWEIWYVVILPQLQGWDAVILGSKAGETKGHWRPKEMVRYENDSIDRNTYIKNKNKY